MNMDMVPKSLWVLRDASDLDTLVLNVPQPENLIDQIISSATLLSAPSKVDCSDMRGYFRYEAIFKVEETLLNQFFNARSGYRAQYYLSPESGDTFNRLCVEGLARKACTGSSVDKLEQSLLGHHSKVWVVETGNHGADKKLNVARWLGHDIQQYEPNQIRLNGTLINDSGDAYLPDKKKDRALQIHKFGFT